MIDGLNIALQAVIISVIIWIGSTVQKTSEDTAVISAKVEYILKEQERVRDKVEGLEVSPNHQPSR